MFKNLKITTKIITIFTLIIVTSIVIISYEGIRIARKSLVAARIAGLERTADLKVEKIETFLQERIGNIKTVQDYYNVKTNLPIVTQFADDRTNPAYIAAKKMLDSQLKTFQDVYGYEDVMLVSPEGRIVYVTNETHVETEIDNPLPDDPTGKLFEEGRKGVYHSGIYRKDIEGNEFEMLITAPAYDFNGGFIGVIAFEIDMDLIYEFIQDTTGLGETGETLIGKNMGNHALFLNPLRHDPEGAFQRKAIYGKKEAFPIQEATRGRSGSGLSVDYRGEKIIAAWRYIPSVDCGLVAKIDTAEAFAHINQLKKDIFLITAGILVLSVVAVFLFSRTITRPVKILSEASQKISTGDLSEQVKVKSKDEIGILASSFNTMRIQLGILIKNIEEGRKDWESMFYSVKDIIALYDKNSRLIRCNSALLEGLNVKSKEIIGKKCSEIFHQIKKEDLRKFAVMDMAKILKPVTNEMKVLCLGGIFSISSFPRFDDNGEFAGTIQIMKDITEKKQAEESLKLHAYQQEEIIKIGRRALKGIGISTLFDEVVSIVARTLDVEFCKILELMPDGKAFLLRAGVGWKEGYVGHATVGTGRDSQAGYTLLSNESVIVEDLRTETRFSAPPLLKDHGAISGMSVIIQGEKRPFGVLGVHTTRRRTFSKDDANFIQAIANVLAESIERKQIEMQFRSIFDNSADGIIAINERGIIRLFNLAAEKLFGYTTAEVIGQNVKILMPEPYRSEHDGYLNRYISTGKGHIIGIGPREVQGLQRDGNTFSMELAVAEMRMGEQRMFIGILRDITKRKEMEKNIMESYKMASLGTLTAGVCHEVLNPLNIISSYAQLLLTDTEKGSKTENDLKKILEEVGRIVKITDSLLGFSRKEELEFKEVEVNSLLEKIISIIEPEMKLENIKLIRIFEEGLPRIMANDDELRQVFLNLITNAQGAMPGGGNLTIITQSIEKQGKPFVSIKVKDTGEGILEENINNVFDPFFTTKKEGKGTGLGLSISYGIIKNHGGKMRVNSKEGKGTTFIIDLPAKT
ncbi:MAG: two-component sensor kinase [Candidatus Scalindua rubra]|uniref:Sensor protein FixL n=1 Tax=Candidatus Scalindua rubra TaxID=1872076 RepID=A0A1E3XGV5_9BACT|nr:MAG: two-component sensor kinase [Candidatus Scalindua rubra]